MSTDTWTTTEVATIFGVSTAAIWKMVQRGQLNPIRPKTKPLRFRAEQVSDLRSQRMTDDERDRIAAAAQRWLHSA